MSERLGSEELARHRTLLAFELEVVSQKVQRFGWLDMAREVKDRLTQEWVDCLDPFPIAEVKRGISDCLDADHRKCPTEQAVRVAIQRHRAAAVRKAPKDTAEPQEATRDFSDEAVAARRALSAELLGGVAQSVSAPKPQSEAETQRNINAAKKVGE